MKPGSGFWQDADNEDGFSDVSEAFGDRLAQDLAEDAGAGFAKTGEALAKSNALRSLLRLPY